MIGGMKGRRHDTRVVQAVPPRRVVRPSPLCRSLAWFVAFVLTLALYVLLSRVAPRSLPWLAVALVVSAMTGAVILALLKPALARICPHRRDDP